MKHLFQETCIKTTLFMVFTGGVCQAEKSTGREKTGGEKKMGGEKKTGRRRRSHVLLDLQSDLVIH